VPSGASAPCTSPSPPSRPNPRPTGFGALAPGQQQQQLEVEEEQLQGQQHGTRAGRAGRRSVARTPASSVPGSSLPRQGLFNNRRDIYGPGSCGGGGARRAHRAAHEARRLRLRAPPPGFPNPARCHPRGRMETPAVL
jgi:hypothetical protein